MVWSGLAILAPIDRSTACFGVGTRLRLDGLAFRPGNQSWSGGVTPTDQSIESSASTKSPKKSPYTHHTNALINALADADQKSKKSDNACSRSTQKDPRPTLDRSDRSCQAIDRTRRPRARHPAAEGDLAATVRTAATSVAGPEAAWQVRAAVRTVRSLLQKAARAAAGVAGARTASAAAGTRLASHAGDDWVRGCCRDRSGRRRRVRGGRAWSVMRVGCRTPVLYSRNQSRTNRVLLDKGDGGGVNLPS